MAESVVVQGLAYRGFRVRVFLSNGSFSATKGVRTVLATDYDKLKEKVDGLVSLRPRKGAVRWKRALLVHVHENDSGSFWSITLEKVMVGEVRGERKFIAGHRQMARTIGNTWLRVCQPVPDSAVILPYSESLMDGMMEKLRDVLSIEGAGND